MANLEPLLLCKLFACAFFAACLLQSSLDKVFDRQGNLDWLLPHFAKSPFRNWVPAALTGLTVLELASGAGSAAAVVSLFLGGPDWIPVASMSAVCFTFFVLFASQRIAKDYAGAACLASYFAVALLGLYLVGLP
jgi:hypothetical protein